MGSTGFPDSLMAFDSTFSFSESTQRPLQYSVRLLSTLLLNQFDMPIEERVSEKSYIVYFQRQKQD